MAARCCGAATSAPGSVVGGIHWGIAYDGERVFAPITVFPGRGWESRIGQKAGLHAVKVDTGEVAWSFEPQGRLQRRAGDSREELRGGIGLSGAATVIDGAVIAGSLDGFLRVFDAATGELLFQYDTAKTFETLNGVPGSGGAIDNVSIVAANGYVFVNSGYGLMAQADARECVPGVSEAEIGEEALNRRAAERAGMLRMSTGSPQSPGG